MALMPETSASGLWMNMDEEDGKPGARFRQPGRSNANPGVPPRSLYSVLNLLGTRGPLALGGRERPCSLFRTPLHDSHIGEIYENVPGK